MSERCIKHVTTYCTCLCVFAICFSTGSMSECCVKHVTTYCTCLCVFAICLSTGSMSGCDEILLFLSLGFCPIHSKGCSIDSPSVYCAACRSLSLSGCCYSLSQSTICAVFTCASCCADPLGTILCPSVSCVIPIMVCRRNVTYNCLCLSCSPSFSERCCVLGIACLGTGRSLALLGCNCCINRHIVCGIISTYTCRCASLTVRCKVVSYAPAVVCCINCFILAAEFFIAYATVYNRVVVAVLCTGCRNHILNNRCARGMSVRTRFCSEIVYNHRRKSGYVELDVFLAISALKLNYRRIFVRARLVTCCEHVSYVIGVLRELCACRYRKDNLDLTVLREVFLVSLGPLFVFLVVILESYVMELGLNVFYLYQCVILYGLCDYFLNRRIGHYVFELFSSGVTLNGSSLLLDLVNNALRYIGNGILLVVERVFYKVCLRQCASQFVSACAVINRFV